MRYVVANPSSYAYFDDRRPVPAISATCAGFNDWKYGMDARPAYLAAPAIAALEKAYVARRVIHLLGTQDTNPDHPALDKSCMAEAQGPYRYRPRPRLHRHDAGTRRWRAQPYGVGRTRRRPRWRQDADIAVRTCGAVRHDGMRPRPEGASAASNAAQETARLTVEEG